MNKESLRKHIELYKSTEDIIFELHNKFGINVWDSTKPNFYNNYNLIIHNLLVDIFGEKKVELLEDYMFDDDINLSFDELWEILNKNETN